VLRAIALALAVLLLSAGVAVAAAPSPKEVRHRHELWKRSMASAKRYARARLGRVSFAVVDDTGVLRSFHGGRRYRSASVVKAMLLVAYLRRRSVRDRPLPGPASRTLAPMIRRSDNAAASRILAIVGYRGLARLARRAGMTRFATRPAWGDTQITANDQARFFVQVDKLVPPRHRSYARRLLRHIVGPQRWGIPPALPPRTRAFFKGGWRPVTGGWIVHQVALLEGRRRRASIAVLTDHDRTDGYGHETIRGIAKRALRPLVLR
jgi:hypothetical protein